MSLKLSIVGNLSKSGRQTVPQTRSFTLNAYNKPEIKSVDEAKQEHTGQNARNPFDTNKISTYRSVPSQILC